MIACAVCAVREFHLIPNQIHCISSNYSVIAVYRFRKKSLFFSFFFENFIFSLFSRLILRKVSFFSRFFLWRKSRFFTFLFFKKTSPTLTGTNTRKKLFFRSLVPIKDFSGVSGLFHCYPPPSLCPPGFKKRRMKTRFLRV